VTILFQARKESKMDKMTEFDDELEILENWFSSNNKDLNHYRTYQLNLI
jgi:hypothetical protein